MSHVLIIYGTGEGQTKKIANAMAKTLLAQGHLVTVVKGDHWHPPERADVYDAFIIGASIHADQHQPYILNWIKAHQDTLATKPSAFFSVSLTAKAEAGSSDYEKAAQYVLDLMIETGWTPILTASLAGAMPFTRMPLLKRFALWFMTWQSGQRYDVHRDYEYTNWESVRAFALAFGRMIDPTFITPLTTQSNHKFADIDVSAWAI